MVNNETPIRIVLVDDQPIIRQGLRYMLNAQPDMLVAGEAANGDEAISVVLDALPDVVLMDIQMPKRSGIEATKAILSQRPQTKIILLTTFDVEEYVYDGIRFGAVGYLLKDTDTKELLDSIRLAYQGAAIFRTTTAGKALAQAITMDETTPAPFHTQPLTLVDPLTEREIEVLQQMAYGHRNHEIAKILNVSEGTVKTHVHRILQKFGVEDRTQAVVMAIRQQFVQ